MQSITLAITNELRSIVKFFKWFFEVLLALSVLGLGGFILLSIPASIAYAFEYKSYWAGGYYIFMMYLIFRFGSS